MWAQDLSGKLQLSQQEVHSLQASAQRQKDEAASQQREQEAAMAAATQAAEEKLHAQLAAKYEGILDRATAFLKEQHAQERDAAQAAAQQQLAAVQNDHAHILAAAVSEAKAAADADAQLRLATLRADCAAQSKKANDELSAQRTELDLAKAEVRALSCMQSCEPRDDQLEHEVVLCRLRRRTRSCRS